MLKEKSLMSHMVKISRHKDFFFLTSLFVLENQVSNSTGGINGNAVGCI